MKILVTGGAGFIGSNFIHYLLREHPEDQIINFDLLTYAGNLANLTDIENNANYTFVQGSITDNRLIEQVIKENSCDAIINFAAESHVDRSILYPEIFVKTNVQGTAVLLHAAKKFGLKKYVQVSTDEVYGSLTTSGSFTEETPLAPNSPYAASKASADLLVRAYHQTYGLNVNVVRCSNNYGPFQYPEKLIPLLITNGVDRRKLPLYGDGENIRDWLYVLDHCCALDLVLHRGEKGAVYNVGGHNERTNNEIATLIIAELGLSKQSLKYVNDRLGHDRRYAMDATKIENELGWHPIHDFEISLKETIRWYLKNEKWWRGLK
ncbi:dTDP-glucose 4,6-dehydratase [Liquorilactobacillus capillatus]|uniref:dTDP-glucose 4,6-dehydratase n=1 Tax=Liquorilactobacillus capillatus DSM 19910 TaxID=1423731 RepID=A0A0R1LZC9_9LACO|nr:dTDP-glucose 4,6-dehydratase [Liquorilactobacillus capillatus]KRL00991.1 hypothetical protein FC81_GL001593 [Liquorilactobacillus capillatus DSM 19910]